MGPKLLRRTESLDIDSWRRRASLEATLIDEKEKGMVSRLYESISLLYKTLLQSLAASDIPLEKPVHRRLESGYTTFVVWDKDYGAKDGSLDDILKTSQKLQLCTLRIMIRICGSLVEELLPHILSRLDPDTEIWQRIQSVSKIVSSTMEEAFMLVQGAGGGTGDTDDESDGEAESTTESTLEEIVVSIKNDVECLMDLGPRFDDPVPDIHVSDDEEPAGVDLTTGPTWDPLRLFRDRIKAKFPKCIPDLATVLSKANFNAMIRLQEERENASSDIAAVASSILQVAEEAESKPASRFDSGLGSSLDTATLAPIVLQGSIAATNSSYAPTIMSFGEGGTTRARLPPQPKGLAIGELFPCIACGKNVMKSRSTRAWKRHVMSDLRPWVCCQMACPCLHVAHSTREEWQKHLRAQHLLHPDWDDKNCPFCGEFIKRGGPLMIEHVETHLQEISLAALPCQVDVDEDEDADSDRSARGSESGRQETEPPASALSTAAPQLVERESVEDHPLYKTATPQDDGLWHCPWEGEDCCIHEPSIDRTEFNNFIEFHLNSFRCKIKGCEASGRGFSSSECLRLHEQETHGLHRGTDRPYLCTSKGCGRSIPGNGFASPWVLKDHVKVVHGHLDLPPLPADLETLISAARESPGTGAMPQKRSARSLDTNLD